MVSYILCNAGCLVKVSLKLCFLDKVPTTFVHGGDFGNINSSAVRKIDH